MGYNHQAGPDKHKSSYCLAIFWFIAYVGCGFDAFDASDDQQERNMNWWISHIRKGQLGLVSQLVWPSGRSADHNGKWVLGLQAATTHDPFCQRIKWIKNILIWSQHDTWYHDSPTSEQIKLIVYKDEFATSVFGTKERKQRLLESLIWGAMILNAIPKNVSVRSCWKKERNQISQITKSTPLHSTPSSCNSSSRKQPIITAFLPNLTLVLVLLYGKDLHLLTCRYYPRSLCITPPSFSCYLINLELTLSQIIPSSKLGQLW